MDEGTLIPKPPAEVEGEPVVFPTSRFGEVSVPEERVMEFPHGLVGLPHARRFVFLHQDEAQGTFFWMQSVDDPALAFVVCEPQTFFPSYRVPLAEPEQELLAIDREEEGLVCVILVIPADPRGITANLRGPLVLNPERRVGIQLVLAGEEYPVRAPIFDDGPGEGGASCSS